MSLSESEKKYGSASLSVSLSILKISRNFLILHGFWFHPCCIGPAGLVPAGLDPDVFIPAELGPAGLDPVGFIPAALGPAGLAPAEQWHVEEDCS